MSNQQYPHSDKSYVKQMESRGRCQGLNVDGGKMRPNELQWEVDRPLRCLTLKNTLSGTIFVPKRSMSKVSRSSADEVLMFTLHARYLCCNKLLITSEADERIVLKIYSL